MPRPRMTAAQREAARVDHRMRALADGVAIYGARKRLNRIGLAQDLGVNERTLDKLTRAEPVSLPTIRLFQIFEKIGMGVTL